MMSDSLRQVVERARRDPFEESDEPSLVQRLMSTGGKIGIAAVLVLLVAGTRLLATHQHRRADQKHIHLDQGADSAGAGAR